MSFTAETDRYEALLSSDLDHQARQRYCDIAANMAFFEHLEALGDVAATDINVAAGDTTLSVVRFYTHKHGDRNPVNNVALSLVPSLARHSGYANRTDVSVGWMGVENVLNAEEDELTAARKGEVALLRRIVKDELQFGASAVRTAFSFVSGDWLRLNLEGMTDHQIHEAPDSLARIRELSRVQELRVGSAELAVAEVPDMAASQRGNEDFLDYLAYTKAAIALNAQVAFGLEPTPTGQ